MFIFLLSFLLISKSFSLMLPDAFALDLTEKMMGATEEMSEKILQQSVFDHTHKLINKTDSFNGSVRDYIWESFSEPTLVGFLNSDRSLKSMDTFAKHCRKSLGLWADQVGWNHLVKKSAVDVLEELKSIVAWFVYNAVMVLGTFTLFVILYNFIKGKPIKINF